MNYKSQLILAVLMLFSCCPLFASDTSNVELRDTSKASADTVKATLNDSAVTSKIDSTAENRVIIYYFHGNRRCQTCINLEKFARQAVDSNFAERIENGILEFKAINVDEKENEHYNEDYELYTKALILSRVKDGKEVDWINLDKIWELVKNETKYKDYVTSELNEFLGDKD